MQETRYYRAIWISDVHLGARACKAESLLQFLRNHLAETLYLVGDIIDGSKSAPSWHFSPAQQAVVDEIAGWRKRGTNVIFLPGNHDEPNISLVEELFGRIPRISSLIHRTASGAKMLVIHGHQFDGSLNLNRLFGVIGARSYGPAARRIHEWYAHEPEDGGRSISDYVRFHARRALDFLTEFRDRAVLAAARKHKTDGVICGHIHRRDQRLIGPVWYVNDGDWVQSHTAAVEEPDGAICLLQWRAPRIANPAVRPMLQEVMS
ncbi:MAG TPA: UDP-2,3-diacylglucosamine diphosphatase [Candidatus Binataceae bacterium]|nr:UDP-2,3-diacylglucosamine diphosphatase [Candidatus Binataceae bacterium]